MFAAQAQIGKDDDAAKEKKAFFHFPPTLPSTLAGLLMQVTDKRVEASYYIGMV